MLFERKLPWFFGYKYWIALGGMSWVLWRRSVFWWDGLDLISAGMVSLDSGMSSFYTTRWIETGYQGHEDKPNLVVLLFRGIRFPVLVVFSCPSITHAGIPRPNFLGVTFNHTLDDSSIYSWNHYRNRPSDRNGCSRMQDNLFQNLISRENDTFVKTFFPLKKYPRSGQISHWQQTTLLNREVRELSSPLRDWQVSLKLLSLKPWFETKYVMMTECNLSFNGPRSMIPVPSSQGRYRERHQRTFSLLFVHPEGWLSPFVVLFLPHGQ